MAVSPWLQVALAALPHITELVKSSKDLLKNNKLPKRTDEPLVIDASDPQALATQLARVASACENNSDSIQILAEQMQSQLQNTSITLIQVQHKLRRAYMLTTAAFMIAALALIKAFGFI